MNEVFKAIYYIHFNAIPSKISGAIEYVRVIMRAKLQSHLYGKEKTKKVILRLLEMI